MQLSLGISAVVMMLTNFHAVIISMVLCSAGQGFLKMVQSVLLAHSKQDPSQAFVLYRTCSCGNEMKKL